MYAYFVVSLNNRQFEEKFHCLFLVDANFTSSEEISGSGFVLIEYIMENWLHKPPMGFTFSQVIGKYLNGFSVRIFYWKCISARSCWLLLNYSGRVPSGSCC